MKIEIELTDIEYEIINKAIEAPIRQYLISRMKDMGFKESEDEIMKAWGSVQEKWANVF